MKAQDQANQTILNILGLGHMRHVVSVRLSLRPNQYPVARVEAHVDAGDSDPTPLFRAFELHPALPSMLDEMVSAAMDRLKSSIAASASEHAVNLATSFRIAYTVMEARHSEHVCATRIIGRFGLKPLMGSWGFTCAERWIEAATHDAWRREWLPRNQVLWKALID